jgi:hypothetical protein
MRWWADRVDPKSAPRRTSYSFTFELFQGIKFWDDGHGCPLWYHGEDDYQRAYTESGLVTPIGDDDAHSTH